MLTLYVPLIDCTFLSNPSTVNAIPMKLYDLPFTYTLTAPWTKEQQLLSFCYKAATFDTVDHDIIQH